MCTHRFTAEELIIPLCRQKNNPLKSHQINSYLIITRCNQLISAQNGS